MADSSSSESGAEPGNDQLFAEAQKLLAKPPRPSEHPTDSFWMHTPPIISEIELETAALQTKPYEIAVIGGGLTGVCAAYWLTENGVPGDHILILDARQLGGGATGRNGGHCWPSTRVWDRDYEAEIGASNLKAAEAWKYRSAAEFMDWIEGTWPHSQIYRPYYDDESAYNFFLANNIDCDLVRTACCAVTRFDVEMEGYKELTDEKKAVMKELGVEIDLWDEKKCNEALHSEKWKGGLHQSLAGQFWPRKAVLGIAKILLERGVHIRTKTPVTEIVRQESSSSEKEFLLHTGAGSVHCKRLVHATNGYASRLLPHLTGAVVPVRGQVVVTSPINSFWIPHNIGFNDGHEYLIHRKEDKRIVFGGMRWRAETVGKEVGVTDDSVLDEHVSDGLRSELTDLFPGLKKETGYKIEQEWSGIMGFSSDSWPLIGKASDKDDEWIAAGYSGNGMPQCFGAGKAIAEMMTGKLDSSKWIPQFDPLRFKDPSYALKWIYDGTKPLRTDE